MMSATDDTPRDEENASAQEFTQSTNDSPVCVSSGGGGGGGGASANEYPNEYPPNPTNDEVAFDVHIGDDATVAHASPSRASSSRHLSRHSSMNSVPGLAAVPQNLTPSLPIQHPFKPDTRDTVFWGWVIGILMSSIMVAGIFVPANTASWLISLIGVIELVMHTWPVCCGYKLPKDTLENFTNVLYMSIMHFLGSIFGFFFAFTLSFTASYWHIVVCANDALAGACLFAFYFVKRHQAKLAAENASE
mmetsp:Transcript_40916/g.60089  ORF Transcript_40916/g.60089 Transcript_40916/m.60089 type:complete len:248 (-) Transcript_40916:119-862(-)|eukprot:CAMPEP_0195511494 /NCGR_PEP_ID=MMETSP0794_2-20130614/3790_1 /TAXON_ID=515487 /ORGANISM="Stephanopyxis turris, Strain CCMP 815" /LENGTH=247 /DNA_ID=CAMNT_0040639095 /DNA_START=95 /DNA_END=838 /DNA_ORIENTATION=+